jgi:hypothetical protein
MSSDPKSNPFEPELVRPDDPDAILGSGKMKLSRLRSKGERWVFKGFFGERILGGFEEDNTEKVQGRLACFLRKVLFSY